MLCKRIGDQPIADIEAPELLKVIRAVKSRGTFETAKRCLQVAGRVFRFAVAFGLAARDPAHDLKDALVDHDPVRRPSVDEAKPFAELLRAIDGYGGHGPTKAALQLMALLFPRPGELRRAQWDEFTLEGDAPPVDHSSPTHEDAPQESPAALRAPVEAGLLHPAGTQGTDRFKYLRVRVTACGQAHQRKRHELCLAGTRL